jgi:tetratricopeptide (TPR) repeat protein
MRITPFQYYCRGIVRLCLVAIVCYGIGVALSLVGLADIPAWWLWSIIVWVGLPYILMVGDLRRAAALAPSEAKKWRHALRAYGIGVYIVPFFYFLAGDRTLGRRPRQRPKGKLSVLLVVAMLVCVSCKEAQRGYALNRAGELYEQGKFKEAVPLYRKAIQANPEFTAAHCGLGNALRKVDKVDEAIASYQKAVELEPTYIRCRYPLSILLFERGRYDEAGREFTILGEQDSTICESKIYLAVIAEAKGRIVDARQLFSSAHPECISRVPGAAAAYERVKKP